MKSVKIVFGGENGVWVDPSEGVDSYLNEMQTFVSNSVADLSDERRIHPLRGTLLLRTIRSGFALDGVAGKNTAAAAAVRTAFFMAALESTSARSRERKDLVIFFDLKAVSFYGRKLNLNAGFRFQDGTTSFFK